MMQNTTIQIKASQHDAKDNRKLTKDQFHTFDLQPTNKATATFLLKKKWRKEQQPISKDMI